MNTLGLILIYALGIVSFSVGMIPFYMFLERFEKNSPSFSKNLTFFASDKVLNYFKISRLDLLAFIFNFCKGAFTVLILSHFTQHLLLNGGWDLGNLNWDHLEWVIGLFIVLGEVIGFWREHSHSKGLAVVCGVLAILSPFAAMGLTVGFLLAYMIQQNFEQAGLLAILAAVAVQLVFQSPDFHLFAGGIMAFVILIRHENEIGNLISTSEGN